MNFFEKTHKYCSMNILNEIDFDYLDLVNKNPEQYQNLPNKMSRSIMTSSLSHLVRECCVFWGKK